MKWAWRQCLPPTVKLTLLALADAADDHGCGIPSASALAKVCGVSTRTIRRALRDLAKAGLLQSAERRLRDGSRISNRYVLALDPEDRLPGPPVTDVSGPGRGWQGDADDNDHGRDHPVLPNLAADFAWQISADALPKVGDSKRSMEDVASGKPALTLDTSTTERPDKGLAFLRRVIG